MFEALIPPSEYLSLSLVARVKLDSKRSNIPMRFVLFSFAYLATGYIFLSREECLTRWIDRSKEKYPNYACAFFRRYQSRKRGEWYEFRVRYCGLYQFEGFCAPKGCKSCIIGRVGDGGYINWRFDPDAFTRVEEVLYVK
ncbi:hypothetical protein DSO57_1014467 [Entomophthora muscae]|uniref:Uncharacterized protein n=1 Tax=Entomophthora muscae TaxID=34485 RepID=A0ACC2RWF9_9FUNG|nr:hypothetical protein DSO57_1014467 [Entomophthora muscae]